MHAGLDGIGNSVVKVHTFCNPDRRSTTTREPIGEGESLQSCRVQGRARKLRERSGGRIHAAARTV
jgi:hypothetical protein